MKKLRGVFVVLCVCASAFADIASYIDQSAPAWRYSANSTVQGWEFGTNSKFPAPDLINNPYGEPSIMIAPTKPWFATWGGHQGVWHLSGVVLTDIANNPVENLYKLVQVQFVWASEDNVSIPCVTISANLSDGSAVPETDIVLLSKTDTQLEATQMPSAGQYWYHSAYLFKIIPNPAYESISVGSAIVIDGLVIDTICIPEPLTGCMLGIMSLALVRRRK